MSRPTTIFRVLVICAAVLALMVGAAGIAMADDPPVETTQTETTEPTTPPTDPPVDPPTTPPTEPTTTPTEPTTTTSTTAAPPKGNLGALPGTTSRTASTSTEGGLAALAAASNRVEVTKAVQPGDPSTAFSMTLQRCTLFIGI
jgi:hypothetical protein